MINVSTTAIVIAANITSIVISIFSSRFNVIHLLRLFRFVENRLSISEYVYAKYHR
ncbi:hypothetical protein [Rossellomorea marisflavi]|uniref:hypothetical protein n=1 Tax=Rossellomorea marisflavi TaxID=189381 RepID=UPI0015C45ED1|nr:hypothetical protein [Rossellomorea marisflavi]